MTIIENTFNLNEIVYLKTDVEQLERLITHISIDVNHNIEYRLTMGTEATWHLECEIAKEKNLVKQIGGNKLNK